jgi:hypothetical protein
MHLEKSCLSRFVTTIKVHKIIDFGDELASVSREYHAYTLGSCWNVKLQTCQGVKMTDCSLNKQFVADVLR